MLNSTDFDIYECSRRLRDLRTKTKTSFSTLADAIGVSSQVLKNYELACRYQDCPENLQPAKTEAIAGMSIDKLYKIARYYNVSADYILGFTDYPTIDMTVRSICEYTGLSEKAIVMLKYLNDRKNIRSYIDLLSCIIASSDFEYLLGLLEGYISPNQESISAEFSMSRADINYKDLCIFTANNALRSILDEAGEEFLKQYKTTDIRLEEYYDEKLKSKGRC